MAEPRSGKTTSPVVRALTIVALLLVIVAAVRYAFMALDLRHGEELYQQEKYQEAINLLEPLSRKMLAAIGLRARAERIVGLSKAEMASRIALEKRSVAGYDEALMLLEQAQRLAGPSREIQDRIDEYTEYRNALLANEKRTPGAESPAPLPEKPNPPSEVR